MDICSTCNGRGEIRVRETETPGLTFQLDDECDACDGTGRVT